MKNRLWMWKGIFLLSVAFAHQACAIDHREEQSIGRHYRVVLDPLHETILSTEVIAPIEEIPFKMGESFKKGDLLLQLDDAIFQANYEKAKAHLARAETELKARKELYDDNVATIIDVREAQADVASAKADFVVAKKRLEATRITAPYSGKVVTVMIDEHELPTVGKELIEIVDDNVLVAKFLIPSTFLKNMSIGQPIKIKLRDTGQEVMGVVVRIGSVIDPASSTVRVEAEIDNEDGELKSGMTGTVAL